MKKPGAPTPGGISIPSTKGIIARYPAQLNRLGCDISRRIHALSERALFLELVAGANLTDRRPVYSAIDPTILATLGEVALPPAVRAIGRAFE